MPRDGTKNLKPMNQRTKEEARKIARKGGINSGKARRKKANLKKALNTILTAKVPQKQMAELLEGMGFENSVEMAIMFSMANEAMKGNVRAGELVFNIVHNGKDEQDLKEQKERIKQMRLDNKERESQSKAEDEQIIIADSWRGESEKG